MMGRVGVRRMNELLVTHLRHEIPRSLLKTVNRNTVFYVGPSIDCR